MRTDVFNLAFAYLRLSDDEKEGKSESASISNQRMMIQNTVSSMESYWLTSLWTMVGLVEILTVLHSRGCFNS